MQNIIITITSCSEPNKLHPDLTELNDVYFNLDCVIEFIKK